MRSWITIKSWYTLGRAGVLAGLAAVFLAGGWAGQTDRASASDGRRLAVTIENLSEPVVCAEKDNVTLTFRQPGVTGFRIEASHPVYLDTLRRDNWKADWTDCDFGPEPPPSDKPRTPKPPERVTIYEEPAQWLVGWRFEHFWRPSTATVRVGERVEKGLHLIQLWRIRPNGGEEVVVMYPQDGYWRARPLAPEGRDLTAFGSSFLIGPVEMQGRPVVELNEVVFEPKDNRFVLAFKSGGSATVTLAEVSAQRTALEVAFDRAIAGRPFAALRSMFITRFNNDVARVAVRNEAGTRWLESDILGFKGGTFTDLWAGRTVPSQHNTSAPDMVFRAFK
jgi:hypothetical protein